MSTKLYTEPAPFTYEVGIDEPVHPDVDITLRFREYALGECEYGCKIYRDPISGVKVLAHFSVYGCTKKKQEIV